MNFDELKKTEAENLMPTYGRFPVDLDHGEGATAWNHAGQPYIDFGSGIGVNALGYCDKGWVAAVEAQLNTLQHTSNLYYSAPQIRLAEKLCRLTGMDKVFFGNSGAEANECAIKLARKYSFDTYGPGRDTILTLVNSFHGRTVTTLSATGQEVFHNYFFPFTGSFGYVEAGDFPALKTAADKTVCAVMLEMIQGEGGVNPLDPAYVEAVAAFCKAHDILLIVDEVQSGVGRTGTFLAAEQYNLSPDIVTLAKGLGGGLPIGACLCTAPLGKVMGPSTHGSTFGGNPVVSAGAAYILDTVSKPEFLHSVREKGEVIRARLSGLSNLREVRGLGLMLGIDLINGDAKTAANRCLEQGLLVLTAKASLRLLPPLNISEAELNRGLDILCSVIESLA